MSSTRHVPPQVSSRQRILESAAALLRDGGLEAVTTRAVEAEAGVQAPTIYRLFGDKQGLLEAVAEHEISAWVASKATAADGDLDRDPVDVLRDGWRSAVEFGLENPALFAMTHGRPSTERRWAAETLGENILLARVRRVAAAGRLAASEERALDLITASARGVVLTLVAKPAEERDLGLLDDVLRGLLSTIITDATIGQRPTTASYAAALRATLREHPATLTQGESALLDELLTRLAQPPRSEQRSA